MEQQPIIKWELNVNQANYVIRILRTRPIEEAEEVYSLLMQQANRPQEKTDKPGLKVVPDNDTANA